jgi:hypothetical protein
VSLGLARQRIIQHFGERSIGKKTAWKNEEEMKGLKWCSEKSVVKKGSE